MFMSNILESERIYEQVPFPLHFPATPLLTQWTSGLLGLEGPQLSFFDPDTFWHLGNLKQSLAGFPHLVLTFLYWQLVLQHEAPAKFPVPGSHSSIGGTTLPSPQTGGTVTEAVGELVGVSVLVEVLVPVPV